MHSHSVLRACMFSLFPVKLLSDLWYPCSEVLSMYEYVQFARRAGSDKPAELLNQWDLSYESQVVSVCSSKFMLWTDTLPRWPCFFQQTLPILECHCVGGDSCWGGHIVGVPHLFPEGKQEVPRFGTLLYAGRFPPSVRWGPEKGSYFYPGLEVWCNGGAEKARLFSFFTQFRFRTENNIGDLEKSILSPSLLRILPVTIHHCISLRAVVVRFWPFSFSRFAYLCVPSLLEYPDHPLWP
jgi:hypothetical protein